ncbi:hypothetical protein JOC37_001344 [Desulfohalotomaculum tongense]|uniref:TrbC/VirB2 family protein n=1 Tax=Desulforadius tongensis TaxID=1216062 RepID=UPI0019593185|nr:TrbC/VirB2 family protein [Desulforadius tongensis]MBM7854964.1 hypothetical protein [Desulforadius tongensis]
MNFKHQKPVLAFLILCFLLISEPSFAVDNPDIGTGLNQIDAKTLADKILKIALGASALSGVIATIVLIFLGFRLKTGNERVRSEVKEHIMYVFIGMGIVGFAVVLVGFAAYLIKGV